MSKTFLAKTKRMKQLFISAQNGLKKLIETYKNCSIIILTLNYYYAILTNYINEIPGKSNCELKLRALYSKKNIPKGDELLLDYPKDYNRFWLSKTKTRKNKK